MEELWELSTAVDFIETCEHFFLLHQEASYHFTSLPVSAQRTFLSPTSVALPRPNKKLLRVWMELRQSRHDFVMPSKTPQSAKTCLCVNDGSWDLKQLKAELGTKMFATPLHRGTDPELMFAHHSLQCPAKPHHGQQCWAEGFGEARDAEELMGDRVFPLLTIWILNKAIYSKSCVAPGQWLKALAVTSTEKRGNTFQNASIWPL